MNVIIWNFINWKKTHFFCIKKWWLLYIGVEDWRYFFAANSSMDISLVHLQIMLMKSLFVQAIETGRKASL